MAADAADAAEPGRAELRGFMGEAPPSGKRSNFITSVDKLRFSSWALIHESYKANATSRLLFVQAPRRSCSKIVPKNN